MRYCGSAVRSFRSRTIDLVKGDFLGPSRIGVLVVDDFEQFRELISSILEESQDLKVIGEAADGLDALQKVEELKPDLILLDIGLPKLDGIAAARRIRSILPEAKIIFVSQDASLDVVREALNIGARGYVIKADAAGEITTAVEAVLRGERFLSTALEDSGLI